jgi:phage terminase large subunit GpA-like protein
MALNMTKLSHIITDFCAVLQPKARLKPSQWADEFAYVPAEGNAEPGKYRTSRMPYQREMLDDAVDATVAESYWKIASQLGKTLCFVIIDGYFIDQDPTGILDVYPTLDSATAYRREKLDPFIKATPQLKGKVKPPRSRDSQNTTLHFRYPGGNLTLCGANSPSGLRQRSKRVVKQDEIDAYEPNAEGDPCTQADKRAETFHNAVKLKSSTPTFKGESRIDDGYEKSDKQQWFCQCAHCKHWQVLEWEQMRFDERDPKTAAYECENCKAHWTDAERIEAICSGEWRATAPFTGIRGRYLNGLYRIIGKKDCHETYLQEFVIEYLKAKEKGELSLIVWENTFRARAYQRKAEAIEIQPLMERRETYKAEVPMGALMLTAGGDVQSDRIECSVWGYGDGEESWLIAHEVFTGNPTEEDVWNRYRDFLMRDEVAPRLLLHRHGPPRHGGLPLHEAVGEVRHLRLQRSWPRLLAAVSCVAGAQQLASCRAVRRRHACHQKPTVLPAARRQAGAALRSLPAQRRARRGFDLLRAVDRGAANHEARAGADREAMGDSRGRGPP